jgi:hypothetical protein
MPCCAKTWLGEPASSELTTQLLTRALGSRRYPSVHAGVNAMIDLYGYSLITIFVVGSTIILVTSEVGWQIGLRDKEHGGLNVSTLQSSILGLLALIIGFTFAMALSRFEARRDAVLNEANAIGTAALRARLLAEPYRTEALKLLREYVQIRINVFQSERSLAEVKTAVERSNAIQEALWQQAKSAASSDTGMVPTGLFIQTLNEMIDNQAKRLSALRNRVPNLVLLALFGIAAVGGGFSGYASALSTKRSRLPVYLMGLLVCAVIMVILDLDRPSSGFIVNNQQVMIDTAEAIAASPELR